MAAERSTRGERAELWLCRALGVEQFRRLLLARERRRHRRDGGSNANYHLSGGSAEALRAYRYPLLYNSAIHVLGLLVVALYYLLRPQLPRTWPAVDWLVPALAALNVWCLLLQRYEALQIRALLRERERRDSLCRTRLARQLREQGALARLGEDGPSRDVLCELTERMLAALRRGELLRLEASHCPALEGLAALLPEERPRPAAGEPAPQVTISQLTEHLGCPERLYDRTQRRMARLGRLLRLDEGMAPLSAGGLLTADAETERSFCRLFPRRDREAVRERLLLLRLLLQPETEAEP